MSLRIQRSGLIAGGRILSPVLLNTSTAIFTRGTEAAIDDVNSVSFVGDNVLRTRLGLYLIEAAETNTVGAKSRDFSGGTPWTAGTATLTANDASGPDGTAAVADRINATSGQFSSYANGIVGAGTSVASLWVRRRDGAGTGKYQGLLGTTGSYATVNTTVGESWTRQKFHQQNAAAAANAFIPVDTRATGPGMTAGAVDVLADLVQLHSGRRYVTSTQKVTTKAADALQWTSLEVPEILRAGRSLWRAWTWYGHGDLASGNIRVLGSFGGANDVLRLRHDGTGVKLEAVSASTTRVSSGYLQWVAESEWTVTIDMLSGEMTVAGMTVGNGVTSGTAGTAWAAAGFRLGGVWGGENEFDGGLAIPEAI